MSYQTLYDNTITSSVAEYDVLGGPGAGQVDVLPIEVYILVTGAGLLGSCAVIMRWNTGTSAESKMITAPLTTIDAEKMQGFTMWFGGTSNVTLEIILSGGAGKAARVIIKYP